MISEALTYEEKLWVFVQGKRLRRFRGLLRSPRSTYCDACGSTQPSHLYGLRDMETKKDFFVGASCMAKLSLMLVVERPFVKSDIIGAYVMARGVPEKLCLPHQPQLGNEESNGHGG
jgi:hypothetical protein